MKVIKKLIINKNQLNLLHDNLFIDTIDISGEELKRFIINNKDLIFKHKISNLSYYLLKNYYKELSKDEKNKIIDIIRYNPEYIEYYCTNILNKKSPEFEEVILTDSTSATNYAIKFFKKRWKEAEAIILTDPSNSVEYAINIIKKRWLEAEKIISMDSFSALVYSQEILKKRWIDVNDLDLKVGFRAEDSILSETDFAIDYAIDIIGDRWKELEKNILNDIRGLDNNNEMIILAEYQEIFKKIIYYIQVLMNNKRWKDLENLLIKNKALNTFRELYAENVIGKSWKEGGVKINPKNKITRNIIPDLEDYF
jgi:hypothetical protein